MKLVIRRRTFFIACTVACAAVLVLMVTHRSDAPVILGRYSPALAATFALVVLAYAAVACLYFLGWRRCEQAYTRVATHALSVVLLLVAINAGAHLATYLTGGAILAPAAVSGAGDAERVHAELLGFDAEEFRAFRAEQGRPENWVYEPWVGFKETPRQGQYINVSRDGYRRTPNSPNEPDHWVFLLGGSTTFGYGVADDQTIATYLQSRLSDLYGAGTFGVRNYGRAYYFSSQEYVLLWTLLRGGAKPGVVVFLDGANELQEEPYYTNEMREMFSRFQDERAGRVPMGGLLADLAVQAPIYPYLRRLRAQPPPAGAERVRPGTAAAHIAQEYERANAMIRLLCDRFGVVPFFVVQPIPGHRNSHGTHVFLNEPLPAKTLDVLALMDESSGNQPQRLNLAGLLEGYRTQPFVDQMHYSPEVHRLIAHAIADGLAPTLQTLSDRRAR